MARAQLLQRLREHVTTISPALRQRAAGPRGDTARLQRLLHKLIAGGACDDVLLYACKGAEHKLAQPSIAGQFDVPGVRKRAMFC